MSLLIGAGALLVATLFSGCSTPPVSQDPGVIPLPPPASPAKPTPVGIQPGETLDVFVMEDDSFNGSYPVRSTGDIIIPKLGRVPVAHLSAKGAEAALARALENNKLTKATVLIDRPNQGTRKSQVVETPGTDVFLSGKVSRPGRYTVVPIGNNPPTVHQAILQAGGCSRFAHKRQAHVLRRGANGKLVRINADLIAIETGVSRDVPLASGDIVIVPEKKVDFGL